MHFIDVYAEIKKSHYIPSRENEILLNFLYICL